MYEDFGARVTGTSVQFRLFFPDRAADPTQYLAGVPGDPRITRLQVAGDFQSEMGGSDWNLASAPDLVRTAHPNGWLWTFQVDGLPEGFYQYKYVAAFQNGDVRWCGDPCTRFVVGSDENSGFVIGGPTATVQPIAAGMQPADLIIYELMIDDFTAEYRAGLAPVDAVRQRIDHLVGLGVNAVEFMPWTGWRNGQFSWGYNPYAFFSVENRYIQSAGPPSPFEQATRLYRLKTLVNDLHVRGVNVIMDGVFNHVDAGPGSDGKGFAYHWLYQEPADSPYTGRYAAGGYFEDLDFHNHCTEQFIYDVCRYWLDTYQLDGIRFDFTLGFLEPADPATGLPTLIADLRAHLQSTGRPNVALFLEHMSDNRYDAIGVTNTVGASGCWYDRFLWDVPAAAVNGCDTKLLRVLDTGFSFDADKHPVPYIENHDHSTAAARVGGRARWWKLQVPTIALYTCAGAVLLHNGQEFAQDESMPENGDGRVLPRPLHWALGDDPTGQWLYYLHARLARIRREHPALRTHNFYPSPYDEKLTHFDDQGYGVNTDTDIVIYHRWGPGTDGRLERFIVVLNFGDTDRWIRIPFSTNGRWADLLNETVVDVQGFELPNHRVGSNWGKVFFQRT
jgi:pullulanase